MLRITSPQSYEYDNVDVLVNQVVLNNNAANPESHLKRAQKYICIHLRW